MRQKLASFEPATAGQEILHAQVPGSFQKFVDARQQRLIGVYVKIPDVLWYAVLVGAAINILLIVMLRMRPVRQVFLGSITAFFLGVILFVIVALDQPLRGEFGLGPGPIRAVWDRMMVWDEPRYQASPWPISPSAKWRACARAGSTSGTRRCARGAARSPTCGARSP